MSGRLTGIARRERSRAPMECLAQAEITVEAGLLGDSKGLKFPLRQITILQRSLWEETLFALGNPDLHWTTRRANLLVEDIQLPRGIGSELSVGPVILEVTAQTVPCAQMDHAYQGLRKALAPDWRGGVTCRVLEGGTIKAGDAVIIRREVPQHKVHLTG
jgi:MOSC domain-containing protein YiiM